MLCAAGWLVGLAGAGTPAAGQDTQPAEADSRAAPTSQPAGEVRPPRSILEMRRLALELGFDLEFDRRDVDYDYRNPVPHSAKQINRARRLEETLGLNTAGSLFGEQFLLYDIAARYGLTQEWFSESRPGPDDDQGSDGTLLEYDVNLTFLPRGVISGNAYAQRLDSRVPRMFQPSLDRTYERYGGGLSVNNAKFPMRFTFEHTWDDLTSRTRELSDDEQRGTDMFRYEGTWQISPNHALRVDYEYNDRHELYSGSRTRYDTTRHYLNLNHVLRFGPDGKSAWETLARLQDEAGDLARDNAELSTRLRLQHTDSLASNYGVQYLRDSFQELTTETWRGEAGLAHQLGQWLTTSAQLYGLQQQQDYNADFCEWGGVLNSAFAQDNAWGRFSANATYNHTATETRHGDRGGIVIGESVTLRDPLPAYLAQTDVNVWSIVVTDAGRTRTYLPARDYVILRMGRYTALRRVVTGQITDRQTVLVSYTYRVYQDYSLRRDRFDFRLQQEFQFGLTPYYAGSFQNEDHNAVRYLAFRERDVNRQRVGATYRRRGWSVGLEYEYNDDALDPYQAMHSNGDVVLWQSARNQLDGRGTLSHFRFRGADELEAHNTTLLDLGCSYRYLLAPNLEANASAFYRYEDDSLNGITNGVDLSAAVDWRLGYFSLRFEAEYDMLDLPGSRDGDMSFWLKLKREIPIISKGAE